MGFVWNPRYSSHLRIRNDSKEESFANMRSSQLNNDYRYDLATTKYFIKRNASASATVLPRPSIARASIARLITPPFIVHTRHSAAFHPLRVTSSSRSQPKGKSYIIRVLHCGVGSNHWCWTLSQARRRFDAREVIPQVREGKVSWLGFLSLLCPEPRMLLSIRSCGDHEDAGPIGVDNMHFKVLLMTWNTVDDTCAGDVCTMHDRRPGEPWNLRASQYHSSHT
jgi:hypothetical protein